MPGFEKDTNPDVVSGGLGSTRFLQRRESALKARPDLKTLCSVCDRPKASHTSRERRKCMMKGCCR